MNTKTILASLVLLVLPAAARTQEIRLSVPDDRDHLRKMTEELIRLSRTKEADAKVDLFLKLSEERAKELGKMQDQGKTTHHDALGKSYEKHVKKGAGGAIENGAAKGKDMTGACGRFAQATARHTPVLERVLANAPPAARKGLLTAIAASQHGHEQAMLAHQRGKGRAGAGGPGGPAGGKQACGCDRDRYKQEVRKQGKSDTDCERETADHFKKNHPDGGDCHCSCDHSKGIGKGKGPGGPPPGKGKGEGGPPPGKGDGKGETEGDGKPKCGSDRDHFKQGLKKQGKSEDDGERETAEHFKKHHPDGGACHCACDHSKGGSKGNNGVGNGLDPQPPGKPPVNDGPGAGPGNPGNKGGPGKGYGPPPGKGPGKPGDDDGPGKGKGPGGPPPGKGPGGDEGPGKGKGAPPPGKGDGKGESEGDGKPKCGSDRDHFKQELKKQGKSEDDGERETAEHFKKHHPDGDACHCTCDHSKGGTKGNNGVGNGLDPQPPGKPPVNDGPGAGPGNPGNKGKSEGPDKGKDHGGPPPGKGKPDKVDESDKGKDKSGPGGKGNGKS